LYSKTEKKEEGKIELKKPNAPPYVTVFKLLRSRPKRRGDTINKPECSFGL
jgi:hypothetical protein